jgi:hypothetical protein
VTRSRKRISVVALLIVSAFALSGSTALASRAPSRSEAAAIRADVPLYLTGGGWHVSGIRISTVNSHYAKAAVQQGRNGAGGEMILFLRHGIYHEVFLGTNDFCTAAVPKRVLRDLGFRC